MPNSKKSTKSPRLQMKNLMEQHPEEFESRDHVVVLFVEEGRFAHTHVKYVTGDISVQGEVTVKCGPNKSFPATVKYIGSESECERRVHFLAKEVDEEDSLARGASSTFQKKTKAKRQDSNIEKSLKKQKQIAKLKTIDIEDDDALSSDESHGEDENEKDASDTRCACACEGQTKAIWKEVERRMEDIEKKLSNIERLFLHSASIRSTLTDTPPPPPPPMKKMKSLVGPQPLPDSPVSGTTENGATASIPTLMYNSTNLCSIPSDSGNVKKFAFSVFKTLFTDDEMVNHAIEPNQKAINNGKIAFDKEKVDLLKRAITLKFGEKIFQRKWQELRKCLNQKCLDKKRDSMKKNNEKNVTLYSDSENNEQ